MKMPWRIKPLAFRLAMLVRSNALERGFDHHMVTAAESSALLKPDELLRSIVDAGFSDSFMNWQEPKQSSGLNGLLPFWEMQAVRDTMAGAPKTPRAQPAVAPGWENSIISQELWTENNLDFDSNMPDFQQTHLKKCDPLMGTDPLGYLSFAKEESLGTKDVASQGLLAQTPTKFSGGTQVPRLVGSPTNIEKKNKKTCDGSLILQSPDSLQRYTKGKTIESIHSEMHTRLTPSNSLNYISAKNHQNTNQALTEEDALPLKGNFFGDNSMFFSGLQQNYPCNNWNEITSEHRNKRKKLSECEYRRGENSCCKIFGQVAEETKSNCDTSRSNMNYLARRYEFPQWNLMPSFEDLQNLSLKIANNSNQMIERENFEIDFKKSLSEQLLSYANLFESFEFPKYNDLQRCEIIFKWLRSFPKGQKIPLGSVQALELRRGFPHKGSKKNINTGRNKGKGSVNQKQIGKRFRMKYALDNLMEHKDVWLENWAHSSGFNLNNKFGNKIPHAFRKTQRIFCMILSYVDIIHSIFSKFIIEPNTKGYGSLIKDASNLLLSFEERAGPYDTIGYGEFSTIFNNNTIRQYDSDFRPNVVVWEFLEIFFKISDRTDILDFLFNDGKVNQKFKGSINDIFSFCMVNMNKEISSQIQKKNILEKDKYITNFISS